MEASRETIGNVQVVRLRGRLDLESTLQFEQFLMQLVREPGAHTVLLECKELRYVGSAGLGTFVAARNQLGKSGKLVFSSLSPQVRQVFDLVRFGTLFEIYATEQQAIAHLNPSEPIP